MPPGRLGEVLGDQGSEGDERVPGSGTEPVQVDLGALRQVLVVGDDLHRPHFRVEVGHQLTQVHRARTGAGRGDHHHGAFHQVPIALGVEPVQRCVRSSGGEVIGRRALVRGWSPSPGGGWGTTLVFGHDFMDDPKPWNESLRLLATEVGPKIPAVR